MLTPTGIREIHVNGSKLCGLSSAFTLMVDLPLKADTIELLLSHHGVPAKISTWRGDQRLEDFETPAELVWMGTITFSGHDIDKVLIEAAGSETALHQLCWEGEQDGALAVEAFAAGGTTVSSTPGGGKVFTFKAQKVTLAGNMPSWDFIQSVSLTSSSAFCVVEVCADIPDSEIMARREEMTRHNREELARWSQTGELLEPFTKYRLKIVTRIETSNDEPREQTEFVYFQTQGPPGLGQLTTPVEASDPFSSGLDTLERYVRQTVPATVPQPGVTLLLPRPVYRAYDVGVRFNEDYVDLMYRIAGRDLGLYLFNSNNQPVRHADGRLIVLSNRWGHEETLTLSESEKRFINTLNARECGSVDIDLIPRDRTDDVIGGSSTRLGYSVRGQAHTAAPTRGFFRDGLGRTCGHRSGLDAGRYRRRRYLRSIHLGSSRVRDTCEPLHKAEKQSTRR
ncbi:MAG: hypothetical protein WKF37_17195 [Bryobacteraceae bacterium]